MCTWSRHAFWCAAKPAGRHCRTFGMLRKRRQCSHERAMRSRSNSLPMTAAKRHSLTWCPTRTNARHLNREYPYASGTENQLAHFIKLGYLTGISDPASAPKNADWRDAAQPLDARARAYLDINCGHCHNAKGPANTTALDLTIFGATDRYLGVCKPPVAAGRGTGDHFFDIVPGNPQDSILPYRMRSSEPGVMMPEQGRNTTHVEGVVLIEQWVSALRGACDTAT